MNSEPTHSYFGTPLSEWISLIPNELEDDAVGLWQIIPTLRKAFGLEGAELERAIREALAKLLARGARPIFGVKGRGWELATQYGDAPDAIIDAIIAEWHRMGRDPDFGDVWFALPSFYENDD